MSWEFLSEEQTEVIDHLKIRQLQLFVLYLKYSPNCSHILENNKLINAVLKIYEK